MKRWPKWQNVVSALTGVAVAVAVNDLSALSHRAQTELFAAVAVVTAAWGIRELPPRARLPRYARWLFLAPAAAATVTAALSPVRSAFILAAVAVILTASAVVLATRLEAAAELLSRAALVGGGVEFIGDGGALLAHRHFLIGATFAGLGVALAGTGLALLTDRRPSLIGAATVSAGPGAAAGLNNYRSGRKEGWSIIRRPEQSRKEPVPELKSVRD